VGNTKGSKDFEANLTHTQEGAKEVLQGLLADLDQSMGLSGIQNIKGCNRSMVRRVQYGGDLKASN
jgi:lactate 2-monooxygenase